MVIEEDVFDKKSQRVEVSQFEYLFGSEYANDRDFCFKTAMAYDEQDAFPLSHLEAVIKSGFFEYFIPKNLGGKLEGFEQLIQLAPVLSRRDMTTAIAVGQTFLGALPVWLAGTDEQKKTLAKYICQGQLGCLALTEKDNGSDILSTKVTATETETGYRLNGEKWIINNATRGATLSVLVRLRQLTGREKLACFFVEKSQLASDEFHYIDKIKTHGIRGADISGICFNNCLVSKSALIPASEPDIYTIFKTLQISRILCAGFSLGAFDTALRVTYRFSVNRRLYAKNIIQIPSVRTTLSDSYLQLLINDVLAQACARVISYIPDQLSLFSAICKYYIPMSTEKAIDTLKVVLGARFYLREEHCLGIFQKMSRDNEVVGVFDGSSPVNLSLISSQMINLAKNHKAGRFGVHPNLENLFRVTTNYDTEHFLNPKFMSLSNNGRDAIIETFMALQRNHRLYPSEKTVVNDIITNSLTILEKNILAVCDEVLVLENNGVNDSACTERITLAKRYSHLFACVTYVLNWYFNRDIHLAVDECIVAAGLCYMLEDVHLSYQSKQDLCAAVLAELDRKYLANHLFALREVRLP
jgi:alkylation response protein AidB-like acyl-CoA dehydrogenase